MQKVAIFGKPGGGKSTLAKALASSQGLALHPLDLIEFKTNGERVDRVEFDRLHDSILNNDQWIIDGMGHREAFAKRLAAADTLIYIDLPYASSHWFVTKRFLKSLFAKPEGWPEGSSVLKGTIASYKTLRLCSQFWNDAFVNRLQKMADDKQLIIINSVKEMNAFMRQH